ncbi:MAG: bifunctional GNAT family N-acetyltransferase/class I SAM-dependent methyltransferase [Chloroflexota bacterium]
MFDFSRFPTLETDRLILRELRLDDGPDVFVFQSDPYVQRFNDVPLKKLEDVYPYISELLVDHFSQKFLIWAVTLRGKDKVFGTVGLGAWNKHHRRAEVGYALAQSHWRQGYGSEAVTAVLKFGYEQLNLNRIYARTIADNFESVGLLEKIGFRLEGIQRGHSWEDDNTFHDGAIFALLKDEFDHIKLKPFEPKTASISPLPDLSEYDDPAIYDLENSGFKPAGPFFLELVKQTGGDVLEIGCGTGRYTIPMAEAGIPMTGLDVVRPMVEVARSRSKNLPIQWIVADARKFSLNHRYSFIFTSGVTFMHLLTTTDQTAFLRCVQRHLAENGRLLIETLFPHLPQQKDELEEGEWFKNEDKNGRVITVSGTQSYDPITQIRTETAYRRWKENGEIITKVAPLSLRNTFPQELELLLSKNGFEVEARYGSYTFEPLTTKSQMMLYLCKKQKGVD